MHLSRLILIASLVLLACFFPLSGSGNLYMLTVDRIEEGCVVLVAEDGVNFCLPAEIIDASIAAGTTLILSAQLAAVSDRKQKVELMLGDLLDDM